MKDRSLHSIGSTYFEQIDDRNQFIISHSAFLLPDSFFSIIL